MARIPLLTPESAANKAAEFLARTPVPLNLFRVLAHAETLLAPQMRLGGALLSEQSLSDRQRELLTLLTARLSTCDYEWSQHVPIALVVGVPQVVVDRIAALDLVSDFDDADRALLGFARQAIETAHADQGAFDRARRFLSERAIVEVLLTVGYYMTMCRVLNATQTDLEADPEAALKLFRGGPAS